MMVKVVDVLGNDTNKVIKLKTGEKLMGRKYNNPPLIEALCEFQFIPAEPYDFNHSRSILYSRKEGFSRKTRATGIGFTVQGSDKGIEQKITPIPSRVQFFK